MTIVATLRAAASTRDYAWLQSAVAGWLHRTDLDQHIADFVMLAEKRINGDLDARLQQGETVLETMAGDATVALPPDFIGVRALADPVAGPLDYLAPAALAARYGASDRGAPRYYTLAGRALRLGPAPSGVRALTLWYRAGVPALADSGGTNWLMERHPDIYLAATMCEALTYTGNDPKKAVWEAKYQTAIASLNAVDWNATGPLAIRPDTATP